MSSKTRAAWRARLSWVTAYLSPAPSFPSLNVSALKRCVASRESAPDVERDIELGKGVAVSGKPTLFINGTRIVGARGSDSIRHLISLEEQRAAAAAFRFSP
jgi:predicted DsbA family dithiol-disulfide isomerase